jgi:hypothetical protein
MQQMRLETDQKEDEDDMDMEMREFELSAAQEEQNIKVAGMQRMQTIKEKAARTQAKKPASSGNGKK